MFLIKRPFSGASRLEGAYSYGKTNQKEEFCKEIGCAEGATGAQGSRQESPPSPSYGAAGGLEKDRETFTEIQTTEHGVPRDSTGPESSGKEAGSVHTPTKTKAPPASRRYGGFDGRCGPGNPSLPR